MNMKRNLNWVRKIQIRPNYYVSYLFSSAYKSYDNMNNLINVSAEAETVTARNDLKLALKRVEDLQQAINGELDSDLDSLAR